MTPRQYNDIRHRAALATWWYWVEVHGLLGHWEKLTTAAATARALVIVGKYGTFRKATGGDLA